jgi:hypothetical protein
VMKHDEDVRPLKKIQDESILSLFFDGDANKSLMGQRCWRKVWLEVSRLGLVTATWGLFRLVLWQN